LNERAKATLVVPEWRLARLEAPIRKALPVTIEEL
jgi:hypothetical protein